MEEGKADRTGVPVLPEFAKTGFTVALFKSITDWKEHEDMDRFLQEVGKLVGESIIEANEVMPPDQDHLERLARDQGYDVDRHCNPPVAYKGPRFNPEKVVKLSQFALPQGEPASDKVLARIQLATVRRYCLERLRRHGEDTDCNGATETVVDYTLQMLEDKLKEALAR